jgi:type III restriction enzyme
MKLQFKVQRYQTDAVDAVVDCFGGQPYHSGVTYRIDPGRGAQQALIENSGFRNAEIVLSPAQLLTNIHTVQRGQNLPLSPSLAQSRAAAVPNTPNLDVEMETGTGKTYVYIKTIMELNKRYGWSKFIVVVPSVAIREGVKKSFDITAEHFQQAYGSKPRAFVYNSAALHELAGYSSDAGVQVMVINIQAFNSRSRDNLRIYDELDNFQSRRPIDVIRANRPIVIIDEPQKIGSDASLESLSRLNALMILRYSATHKVPHDKVYRLDAVDAYNRKLVKKIAVRGITVKALAGSTAYLYLESIEVSKGARPRARVELEVKLRDGGIKRQVRLVDQGTNLCAVSGGLEAYKDEAGKDLVIFDIDANRDVIELSNGDIITAGQVTHDVTDDAKRRLQIREVIRAHLDKERELFTQGIKVLSLFFIDEVAKYRDYQRADTYGEYAQVFVEEYQELLTEELSQLAFDQATKEYRRYLEGIAVGDTHQGYFSIDKKTNRQVNGEIRGTGEERGQSTDVAAYDLILTAKERLLSFDEPVRFIFSHSALREGWDNPNVFVMGMLKKSDNTVSRRQEIGRGLRLSVDQRGERMDNPVTVHEINELTVVTDESYTDFVAALQKEISASLSARPRKASTEYFKGKFVDTESGKVEITEQMANALLRHLIKNDYIDDDFTVTEDYKAAREAGTLVVPTSDILKSVADAIWPLVDALYLDVPRPTDGRKPKRIPVNEDKLHDPEFEELWRRINHKAVYQVAFDSAELVQKCVTSLDANLRVDEMQYFVLRGQQRDTMDTDVLEKGTAFIAGSQETKRSTVSAASRVPYDLLGQIGEQTKLTRRTVGDILKSVRQSTFAQYRRNPEHFIAQCVALINEQKALLLVENLTYELLPDRIKVDILLEAQTKQDFTKASKKLSRSVYEYVVSDSELERKFAEQLDITSEVAAFIKLPGSFVIPTPMGDYNPDWAIAFKEGMVKHVYFVAETKGSLQETQLRPIELAKIKCAEKFFAELNRKHNGAVMYHGVESYDHLMQLVEPTVH